MKNSFIQQDEYFDEAQKLICLRLYRLSLFILCAIILALLLLPQTCFAAEAGSSLSEASHPERESAAQKAQNQPIRVAIIDTGISIQTISGVEILPGKNYVFENNDCIDRIGHGTAVASLILSASDGVDIELVPLVCYDLYPSGVSKPADVYMLSQAVRDAVDIYDCKVINMSMGVTEDVAELREAVEYAENSGALVVSAVGNSNINDPNQCFYPACYPSVIGVGAANGDLAAEFSQRHGVCVLANGTNVKVLSIKNGQALETVNGSSYSCAIVSGLCAAIASDNPNKTQQEIKDILYKYAKDIGPEGFDTDSGWGIVNPLVYKLKVSRRSWYPRMAELLLRKSSALGPQFIARCVISCR